MKEDKWVHSYYVGEWWIWNVIVKSYGHTTKLFRWWKNLGVCNGKWERIG